jgi:hypothetical protein
MFILVSPQSIVVVVPQTASVEPNEPDASAELLDVRSRCQTGYGFENHFDDQPSPIIGGARAIFIFSIERSFPVESLCLRFAPD